MICHQIINEIGRVSPSSQPLLSHPEDGEFTRDVSYLICWDYFTHHAWEEALRHQAGQLENREEHV